MPKSERPNANPRTDPTATLAPSPLNATTLVVATPADAVVVEDFTVVLPVADADAVVEVAFEVVEEVVVVVVVLFAVPLMTLK